MLDFINGVKFSEISNFVVTCDKKELYANIFKSNAIIYLRPDFLDEVFNYIRFSNKKYILITHMSDFPIDFNRFNKRPQCIVKWFGENAVYEHPDLISLPIGLENHKGCTKGSFTNHEWFSNNINKLNKNHKSLKTVYCNWNIDNNRLQRNNILNKLNKNNVDYYWEGGGGKQGLLFEEYCNNMSHYKFVISPPGNGIDCHRTWEALYMGCIPIVIKNRIYNNFSELPIIQVNDYSEVTNELLENELEKNYVIHDKLYFKYWKKLILETFKLL